MNGQAKQHMDDIEVPVLEVDKGWEVDDVKTFEDCNDAHAVLSAAIASIEYQIELDELGGEEPRGVRWRCGAKFALKMKKAALQQVQWKRGAIGTAEQRAINRQRDQLLLEYIRANVPHEQFMAWLKASGANTFQVVNGNSSGT